MFQHRSGTLVWYEYEGFWFFVELIIEEKRIGTVLSWRCRACSYRKFWELAVVFLVPSFFFSENKIKLSRTKCVALSLESYRNAVAGGSISTGFDIYSLRQIFSSSLAGIFHGRRGSWDWNPSYENFCWGWKWNNSKNKYLVHIIRQWRCPG